MSIVVEWQTASEKSKRLLDTSPVAIGGGDQDGLRIPGLPARTATLTFDEDEVWLTIATSAVSVVIFGKTMPEGMKVMLRPSTKVEITGGVSLVARRRSLASVMEERFGPSGAVIDAPLNEGYGPIPRQQEEPSSRRQGTGPRVTAGHQLGAIAPKPATAPDDEDTRPDKSRANAAPKNGGAGAGSIEATPQIPSTKAQDVGVGALLGDRYELVRKIGAGGMGTVFEARDLRFTAGEPVAVKILVPAFAANEEARVRFRREANVASKMRSHDNIVRVYDYGTEPVPYLVMELLKGHDFGRRLTEGTITTEEAIGVILAACAGVHAAHENGVTHRDLKPGNVFVIETGSGTRVKILDFGISTATTAAPLTRPGMVVGTWEYMSPEQARGEPADALSDQYSIGVMLYEALVGRLPFESGNPATLFTNIAEGRFNKPRAVDPTIAPEMEAIILRAMAKDPSRRFPSVQALGAALLPHASADDRTKWVKYFTVSDPNRIHTAPVRKEKSGSVNSPPAPMASEGQVRHKEPTGPTARSAKLSARDRKLIVGLVVTTLAALAVFVLARELIGRGATAPVVVPAGESAGNAKAAAK